MRSHRVLPVLLAISMPAILAACGSNSATDERPARAADLKVEPKLITATNGFGFRIYRELLGGGGNVFVSPTSLELALGMAFNGAQATTKDGMAATLGYGDMTLEQVNEANRQLLVLLANPDPKVDLFIANAVWAKQGVTFDAGFMSRTRDSFLAEAQALDFAAPSGATTINDWVKSKTREKIPTIVTAEAIRDAIMVLTNAIYFKGGWTDAFPEAATKDAPFTKADGKTVTVPMMRRSATWDYLSNDAFQAVRLPFAGKYVSMVVILPASGKKLSEFAESLTTENWNKWMAAMEPKSGEVALPRFKSEFGASVKPALSALGMADAFDTSKADLNGILPPGTTSERVFISDVLHKTYLSVDEQGAEAAAATAVIMGVTSAPADPFQMVVDRPFFLAIVDKPTGAILFLGSISEPK